MISTPSFVRYLARVAREELDLDPASLGLRHMSLGGEPGAGLPHIRREIEREWGAKVHDAMGTADLCTLLWSECDEQAGMHFQAHGAVLLELLDVETGRVVEPREGARVEPVYTSLQRECTPLLRFRSRDLLEVLGVGRCACGRTGLRVRCVGRTDDMLICQGVNIYPSAVADVVVSLRPRTTGVVEVHADSDGPAVAAPVRLTVEYQDDDELDSLRAELERRVREMLLFRASVDLVPKGTLEREGKMKTAMVRRP
jgi:phenylacetate-CoA ligase